MVQFKPHATPSSHRIHEKRYTQIRKSYTNGPAGGRVGGSARATNNVGRGGDRQEGEENEESSLHSSPNDWLGSQNIIGLQKGGVKTLGFRGVGKFGEKGGRRSHRSEKRANRLHDESGPQKGLTWLFTASREQSMQRLHIYKALPRLESRWAVKMHWGGSARTFDRNFQARIVGESSMWRERQRQQQRESLCPPCHRSLRHS